MTPKPKVHSQVGKLDRWNTYGWTRCSRNLHKEFLTTDDRLVTCKHCRSEIITDLHLAKLRAQP